MNQDIRVAAFIAGYQELYAVARNYPNLRMVPIATVGPVREQLKSLGYRTRIRYRGPHLQMRDTLKRNAKAFTVYIRG